MNFFVAGLSYRTAPVEIRERVAVHASRLRCAACRLKIAAGLSEVVLVSTCNRVEIYAVGPWAAYNPGRLFAQLSNGLDLSAYIYAHSGQRAVEHLFSVASGLDSMVIGETEITGQIKQAYTVAQEARLTGKTTNRLFQTAFQVAKQIRTQTAIGRGATSVGSVAVELAERIFDQDLSTRNVMIIGAGKMGEACLKHIAKKGAKSVLVANRSYDRAVKLAQEFGGRPLPFTECFNAMGDADIVVSSTGSPDTILHRADVERVMQSRPNRPLFLIDIAVPRDIDIDVDQLPGVYLYNVDHLEQIVKENMRLRERELALCKQIVTERAAASHARVSGEFSRPIAVKGSPSLVLEGAAA
jgi:glutamyl-tRNA reductase